MGTFSETVATTMQEHIGRSAVQNAREAFILILSR